MSPWSLSYAVLLPTFSYPAISRRYAESTEWEECLIILSAKEGSLRLSVPSLVLSTVKAEIKATVPVPGAAHGLAEEADS